MKSISTFKKGFEFTNLGRQILANPFSTLQKLKLPNINRKTNFTKTFQNCDQILTNLNQELIYSTIVNQAIVLVQSLRKNKRHSEKSTESPDDLELRYKAVVSLLENSNMGKRAEELLVVFSIFLHSKIRKTELFLILLRKFTSTQIDDFDLIRDFLRKWEDYSNRNYFLGPKSQPTETLNFSTTETRLFENYLTDLIDKIIRHDFLITETLMDIFQISLRFVKSGFAERLSTKFSSPEVFQKFKILLFEKLAKNSKNAFRDLKLLTKFIENSNSTSKIPIEDTLPIFIQRNQHLSLPVRIKIYSLICRIYKKLVYFDENVLSEIHGEFLSQSPVHFSRLAELLVVYAFCQTNDSFKINEVLQKMIEKKSSLAIYCRLSSVTLVLELHLALEFFSEHPIHKQLVEQKMQSWLKKLCNNCTSHQLESNPKSLSLANLNSQLLLPETQSFKKTNCFLQQKRYLQSKSKLEFSFLLNARKKLKELFSETHQVKIYINVALCQFEIPILIFFETFGVALVFDFPPSIFSMPKICPQQILRTSKLKKEKMIMIDLRKENFLLDVIRENDVGKFAEFLVSEIKKENLGQNSVQSTEKYSDLTGI